LVEAKIDPRGLGQLFEKLKRLMADSGMAAMENSLSLVNTHPTSQERIDRLAEKWEQLPNKSGFEDLGQWSKLREKDQALHLEMEHQNLVEGTRSQFLGGVSCPN